MIIIDIQSTNNLTHEYLFSQQNVTFKHSVDAKIDLEAIESKRFKGFGV